MPDEQPRQGLARGIEADDVDETMTRMDEAEATDEPRVGSPSVEDPPLLEPAIGEPAAPYAEPRESGSPSSAALALRVLPACLLAWLIPGFGHLVLGRLARGLAFAVVVSTLFAGGIALDGKVYRPMPGEPLTYLAAVGAAGVGVPFAIAHLSGAAEGHVTSPYHDYGNTFTLVAGLLNLLVVIDAYDVALRRR